MLVEYFTLTRCKLEGRIKNVNIGRSCAFNRSRLLKGLEGIAGTKEYPISLTKTRIAGNVGIGYGCSIIDSDFNTSDAGTIRVGRFTSLSDCKVLAGNSAIEIGSFNSIISVKFLATGHDYHRFTTYYIGNHVLKQGKDAALYSKGNISIGNDVWIGANTVVLAPVTIGSGAVVGAGSVVTHDIEPYSIYAGNPARLIRYRFPEEIREALLKSEWWNRNIDDVKLLASIIDVDLVKNWDRLALYFQKEEMR